MGGGWLESPGVKGVCVLQRDPSHCGKICYGALRRRYERPGRAAWAACGCRGEGSIQGTNWGVERTSFGWLGRFIDPRTIHPNSY